LINPTTDTAKAPQVVPMAEQVDDPAKALPAEAANPPDTFLGKQMFSLVPASIARSNSSAGRTNV
jgi:hypothetical protein